MDVRFRSPVSFFFFCDAKAVISDMRGVLLIETTFYSIALPDISNVYYTTHKYGHCLFQPRESVVLKVIRLLQKCYMSPSIA